MSLIWPGLLVLAPHSASHASTRSRGQELSIPQLDRRGITQIAARPVARNDDRLRPGAALIGPAAGLIAQWCPAMRVQIAIASDPIQLGVFKLTVTKRGLFFSKLPQVESVLSA